ncbi:amidoligase family protein, partial [Fodinibius sp.]|uniref:amidoligase family protein n=1 Tax=Fodinibius sp. TaxID=1872440 RepID=UPI003567703B
PDLKTETLLNYLRSFLILYPWLLEELKIDFSRRITPFVDPFPQKYVINILEPSYAPDQEQLISDYMEFNPTRNRPLDMMPIFAWVNKELIYPVMEDKKNVPRPTFHYRLPNSRIDDPVWRFEDEWNLWLEIEKLAGDNEMLHKLSRLYVTRKEETVISFRKEWATTVAILLDLDE